jgi:hypothetical protein
MAPHRSATEHFTEVFRALGASNRPLLERDDAFGVVTQLLAPTLARASPQRADRLLNGAARLAAGALGASGAPALGHERNALHGLYWLVNLSEIAPTVVAVDDMQRADAP